MKIESIEITNLTTECSLLKDRLRLVNPGWLVGGVEITRTLRISEEQVLCAKSLKRETFWKMKVVRATFSLARGQTYVFECVSSFFLFVFVVLGSCLLYDC